VTARCLGKFFFTDGDNLERAYKHSLSDYPEWEQREHASDRVLIQENIGEHLSIDETSLQDDLFTILSNKDGHCKKGTIVAMVRGTRAEGVVEVLLKIPEEERLRVKEVTMDLSESMADIVTQAFPNATIVLDCFHIMRRCNEAIEEMRLRNKREAQAEVRKEKSEFKKRQKRNAAHRRWYRKTHPKKYKGKTRGRKPARKNEKFKPPQLSTGDTRVELLTRTKYALTQTPDKWSERTKERMALLFELYPKIKQSYDIVNKLRAIFRSKTLTKDMAREKLHEWYKIVNRCTIREVKSARNAIKSREDNVLNYFLTRSTNAAAESLNSKIKGFRAQLRGVSDLPFFMYRICTIFG
jgi:Transposase and inactivated derivatives